jgi:hypothetical protein
MDRPAGGPTRPHAAAPSRSICVLLIWDGNQFNCQFWDARRVICRLGSEGAKGRGGEQASRRACAGSASGRPGRLEDARQRVWPPVEWGGFTVKAISASRRRSGRNNRTEHSQWAVMLAEVSAAAPGPVVVVAGDARHPFCKSAARMAGRGSSAGHRFGRPIGGRSAPGDSSFFVCVRPRRTRPRRGRVRHLKRWNPLRSRQSEEEK